MADPRFYDNRGPFTLVDVCARASATLPDDADAAHPIADLATLDGAGPQHLTFRTSKSDGVVELSRAGWCFVGDGEQLSLRSAKPTLIVCHSVQHAFAAAASLFYPE